MSRHRMAWVVGLSLLWATPASASAVEADSAITAVTIFPDRAGVTRQASVKLEPGTHAILFGPLPAHVEADSLAAQARGSGDLTLSGVRVTTRQLAVAQDPKVQALEESIRDAERKQRQLHDARTVLEHERDYLASIQAASSEQIGKDLITKSPSAQDAAALLAFLDEALMKNVARVQETDAALEDVGRELDRLRRELAALTQGRLRQQTLVTVDASTQRGGTYEVELTYRVPGATWLPVYEARASAKGDHVDLLTSGLVRQQTGEEWADVALTLSTARPAIGGSMPELQPWFLSPWEAQPVASGGQVFKRAMLASAPMQEQAADKFDEGKAKSEPEMPATLAYAAAETSGPAVTYQLPDRASVPSDGQPRKVPVAMHQLSAAFAYEATPKLATYAYLRAKVSNTSQELFLPGQVSIFLDGAFVGTGQIKQVAPSETFDLYLGADERVKVKRKGLKERVEVSLLPGLRGKTKSTEYEVLTTLENFTGRTVSVTVFDQVPVSQREEIIVESAKMTPSEIVKDPEKPGVFSWVVELGPSQKQELRLAYRVRHPVEMVVTE